MRTTQTDKKSDQVNRRLFLGTAATTAAVFAAAPALAAGHGNHDHHGHDHSKHGKAHNAKLVSASNACISTGEACMTHCIELLGDGDTSIKDCATAVNEMLPICAALTRLAATDSKRLKQFATVAVGFMSDCAAECKKHADKHASCKACMEACNVAIKEATAIIDA